MPANRRLRFVENGVRRPLMGDTAAALPVDLNLVV
jgi:hypothetical protein